MPKQASPADLLPLSAVEDYCVNSLSAMKLFGRWLQIAGLTIPPLSILLQFGAVKMLASLVFSVCLFLIGWIFQTYGKT